jgi:hypothetical protein
MPSISCKELKDRQDAGDRIIMKIVASAPKDPRLRYDEHYINGETQIFIHLHSHSVVHGWRLMDWPAVIAIEVDYGITGYGLKVDIYNEQRCTTRIFNEYYRTVCEAINEIQRMFDTIRLEYVPDGIVFSIEVGGKTFREHYETHFEETLFIGE